MKKRINDLLNGKFENLQDSLTLTEKEISGHTLENENFLGKFSVMSENEKSIHGFVQSTNPRVGLRPESFSGIGETIRFEADVKGLTAGDILTGEFLLHTTAGVYHLPYRIAIDGKKETNHSEAEVYLTQEEFAALAKEDFGKAYVLFVSGNFRKMMRKWGIHCQILYDGLIAEGLSYRCLEQFLVGIGQKESITLELEQDHLVFERITETRKEEFVLKKNTWGFAVVTITCDADFLKLEKTQVTTEEFLGSVCHIGFVIEKEKLHAGKQFAKITLSSGLEEKYCLIEVNHSSGNIRKKPLHRQKKETVTIESLYIQYRMGSISVDEWTKETLAALERYRQAEGQQIGYDLYESYVLSQSGDTVGAELLLGQIQEREEELKDARWKGCYLYLTMMQNHDADYQEYVKKEIEKLYLENQENWLLLLLMFRANGQMYRNDGERLEEIRNKYRQGSASPILYLEAYEIIKKEPLMLRRMDEFEIHLLAFLCRHHIFDREISGQAAQLAQRVPSFHPILFRVLAACYHFAPTRNLLTAICRMLIEGRKNEKKYVQWFVLGVMQDVKITGLYEYFIETADHLEASELPKAIRLYFVYHNTLDSMKKAAIYAAIIRNKEKDEQTYISYRKVMELFMEEQLAAGKINDDFALLYQDLLTEEVMTTELARGLERVLFTYDVRCSKENLKNLIVEHKALKMEQCVSLNDEMAQVQLMTPDYVLLAEDGDGKRYAAEEFCTVTHLLTDPRLEEICRKYLKNPTLFLLHDCIQEERHIQIDEEHLENYLSLLKIPELKDSYRRELMEHLLKYFAAHPLHPMVEKFFREFELETMAETQMHEIAQLLAGQDRYVELYQLICIYGMEKVDLQILVHMCHALLEEEEKWEDEKMLLAVSMYCFENKLYDEKMLAFLMKHYEGSLERMKEIWYAGKTFKLESYELEEKILVLLLFVQQGAEHTEEIFASYEKKMGKSRICRAYVTWMSYESFIKEKHVDWSVFSYMERNMLGVVGTPDICKLALLKRYTERKEKSAGQQKWMMYLLEKYLREGMHFAFMQKLPKKLKVQYHLNDKYILEYRSTTGKDVVLHYRYQDQEEKSVLLKETFEGIYTKEFTMFYKDTLTWYITEGKDKKDSEIHWQSYTCMSESGRQGSSRYDLINQLIAADEKGNTEQLEELMERYEQQQYLVENIFRLN